MSLPIISIIIPAYNAQLFIVRCLDSVYSSTPCEDLFEVIIINDGSSDNTVGIVEAFSREHHNISIIDKENGGVSSARNIGIAHARGVYVLFLDADDELLEGALIRAYDYLLKSPSVDMLVTRQIRTDGNRVWSSSKPNIKEHIRYTGVEAFQDRYLRMNAGGGICRTLFLKENNILFPEGVTNAEDSIFFGLVQVYAQSVVFYNLNLYKINQQCGSASRCDHTRLGLNHVMAVDTLEKIRVKLDVNKKQKGIIEYLMYQLLSNTVAHFVQSHELSYHKLRKLVSISDILPIRTKEMSMMKHNAILMSYCFPLFYLSSWIKHRCC